MEFKKIIDYMEENKEEYFRKIIRVRCPKCQTAIVHQIKEETNDNKCTVTYYCGSCKEDFTKKYAIGNYS